VRATSRILPTSLWGLFLCGAATAAPAFQEPSGSHSGAPERQAGERSDDAGGPGRRRAALLGESLAEVRALFRRVDADRDGRLDVREADHGGFDWTRSAASDHDRDGKLDAEEFVVARQRELARLGRLAAPNLVAESTRIQALWRARTAQLERERAAAAGADHTAARLARLLGPAPTPGPPPGARAPGANGGPAQARLSEALDSSAAQSAERARRAQMLLELRRREPRPER
jgi:hypothetical protein